MFALGSHFGPYLHNISPLEVLWFVFGCIGFYFAQHNYREATCDLDAIEAEGIPDKSVAALANGHIRTEINRCLIHSIVILVGIVAMMSPPTTASPITPVGVLVTVGLFAISAITISQSVLDRRLRHLLTAIEASKEVNNGQHDLSS